MGFFRSLFRLLGSIFGLAQGSTERAVDKLVSGSPEAIRAQFRKAREDLTQDYNEMREAVSELIKIKNEKVKELNKISESLDSANTKMLGAVNRFKETGEEKYKTAYVTFASEKEQNEKRITDLQADIQTQSNLIEKYKAQLNDFQQQLKKLQQEESETVADIVSSDKIRQINDKLSGISQDSRSKNLEAIREARHKSKTIADLSEELSGKDEKQFEADLDMAGKGSKFLNDFEKLVNLEAFKNPITIIPEKPKALHDPDISKESISGTKSLAEGQLMNRDSFPT